MRSQWMCMGVVAAVVSISAACSEQPVAAVTEFEVVFAKGSAMQNFNTHMTGSEEVPANASRAQGQSTFKLNADGTAIEYRINVANIQNVHMAHIHLAPAGANGPVVAWLYPPAPPAQQIPGRTQGTLAEGVITDADVIARPAIGFDGSMEALIEAMRAGNTYVNVHTMAAGVPSGPGNLPPGEIRGQIRALGPK
jgi:hypothetical protein